MIAVHHLHGGIADDGFLYTLVRCSWENLLLLVIRLLYLHKDDSMMQRDEYGTDKHNT